MQQKKVSPIYRFIKWLAHFFYPAMELVGAENLPDGPCIIVGNHCKPRRLRTLFSRRALYLVRR